MSRTIENLGIELTDLESLAVCEKAIELTAIVFEIDCVEYGPEDLLDVANVLPDPDLGVGLQLEIWRA